MRKKGGVWHEGGGRDVVQDMFWSGAGLAAPASAEGSVSLRPNENPPWGAATSLWKAKAPVSSVVGPPIPVSSPSSSV